MVGRNALLDADRALALPPNAIGNSFRVSVVPRVAVFR